MSAEDPTKKEIVRMKFEEAPISTEFCMPTFKHPKNFLVCKKTGPNEATCCGFRIGSGVSSSSFMQYQGSTIEIKPSEEIEIR